MVRRKGKGSGVAKSGKSTERQERLAAALRENLKRRKARDRALAATPSPGGAETASELPVSGPSQASKSG
ncbi:MAG: hypothetical protein KGL29_06905 [Alphaproteobacteria bacterium]|nr:hypothetical protein [Alphaproteobacteria bacterium]MDE2265613.1 hypothetical protein [Alphaproteobacteria bacterium]